MRTFRDSTYKFQGPSRTWTILRTSQALKIKITKIPGLLKTISDMWEPYTTLSS